MTNPTRFGIVLCLCALACGKQANSAVTAVHADYVPVALDTQLLFVDSNNQQAYLLDVDKPLPAADAKRIKLPAGAVSSQRRLGHDHDEALVLCAGERGSADVEAQDAALVAIDDKGTSRSYTLGATPFDTLTQSDDGRYAVLNRTGQTDARTLNNPNELVVVDLDAKPSDDTAVTRKTPDGLGHTLTSVVVSPVMHIAGEDRRLLVLLSAAEVTLFDLNHLDRRATIVQLDETRSINPVQVEFGKDNPTLYVRAGASDNIFMFRLEPQDNPGGNDFRPTINPISGGVGPRDIKLFGDADTERLLVVAQNSSEALVVDPSSSKTTSLKLSAAAQHILLFNATSPSDTQSRTRALLYADGQTALTFMDLDELTDNPADQLEQLLLTDAVRTVIPQLDASLQVVGLVIMHDRGVTLLNLAERTLTPISASSPLTGALFDSAHKRLLVGPTGQPWVGTLDLTTGKTDEILLDATIQAMVQMPQANRLAITHTSDVGYVTLLDLDAPARETAVSVHGFFISGSLDRGE